ncbi:MAG: tRNA dihydrouridine synthase DusB [Clostridia bacterium]|nr:tRNA dihydrouridine synthase DusB [Clostridia bacterium]
MLKIGDIELNNNIILGPMAGFTDRPYRIICEEYEPGLVVTEMVSAKALLYNDTKTKQLMNTEGEKHPIAVQIFGSDDESMAYSAKYISDNKLADIIDINMGCPAPKVVKNGDGSSLLLDIEKAKRIVEVVVNNSNIPVTVKIRKGWDKNNIVATDIAKAIQDAGAKLITVHGRTRNEYYTGNADWNIIKEVKENVEIPVVGNGDVKTPEDAKKMFEQTGCDGIMISRATLGNPWIFKQINEYLNTGEYGDITRDEKLRVMLKHIDLEIEEKGEERGVKELRKHLCFYIKGERNASELRNTINHLDSVTDVKNILIQKLG